MTPEILSQLKARLQTEPRRLDELHQAAHAAGSAWSAEQVHLLLDCLPEIRDREGLFSLAEEEKADPVVEALLSITTDSPMPAAAIVRRMPKGIVTTAAALCEIAKNHSELELVPPNRIRRR